MSKAQMTTSSFNNFLLQPVINMQIQMSSMIPSKYAYSVILNSYTFPIPIDSNDLESPWTPMTLLWTVLSLLQL